MKHEEIIKHLILPHELKHEHKTRFNNFECFKGSTQPIYLEWLGMGRYGVHIGKTLVLRELDARVDLILSTGEC